MTTYLVSRHKYPNKTEQIQKTSVLRRVAVHQASDYSDPNCQTIENTDSQALQFSRNLSSVPLSIGQQSGMRSQPSSLSFSSSSVLQRMNYLKAAAGNGPSKNPSGPTKQPPIPQVKKKTWEMVIIPSALKHFKDAKDEKWDINSEEDLEKEVKNQWKSIEKTKIKGERGGLVYSIYLGDYKMKGWNGLEPVGCDILCEQVVDDSSVTVYVFHCGPRSGV
jgi:hypothetical protein